MDDYIKYARVFKAFCDEKRLRIIDALREGEKCACTLLEELPIVQSTLSHHMKILVESGVVTSRKDGKWTYYSLSKRGSEEAQRILGTLLEKKEDYRIFQVCDMNGGKV